MNKKLQLVLLALILLIIGCGAYLIFINLNKIPPQTSSLVITNFEECVANGNPVMESYPRQCRYGDKTFVESVGNELEKTNLIRVTSPRPNQVIQSPLTVAGQARGSWFFEASFPVFLTDWDGKIIAQGVAQAKGDWMTTEFVPFEATINFISDKNIYSNKGTLILKKDNPSGLPQNDDALEIPIVFARAKSFGFNQPTTLQINDKVIFSDGTSLILKEINDSRCKSGLTCIWQGELSALFQANINGSLKEIRLGTVNNKKVSIGGYTFSLESATENSVTISVSVNLGGNDTSGVSGYVHQGPICPVEKYPPDPNCADRPVADAAIEVVVKSSGVLAGSVKTDVGGNFRVNLPPATYLIKTRAPNNSILPSCEQKEVVVIANKFINLDISCDTGIR